MLITEDTFIISDTHFGHSNMIAYEPSRTFLADLQSVSGGAGADIVNKVYHKLADNWNAVIGKNDTVLHLGDFVWGGRDNIRTWVNRLNGRIILIKGNHDRDASVYLELGIEVIEGILVNGEHIPASKYVNALITEINGLMIMFSHYPVEEDGIKRDEKFNPAISKLFEIFIEYNCDINVHGHVHSRSLEGSLYCRNVSVEVMGFKPVRIGDILNGI